MKYCWLIFLLLFAMKAKSSHIVGGEIMYKFISKTNNSIKYNITLFIYNDCDNGKPGSIDQDQNGYINIYSYNALNKSYSYYNGTQLTNSRSGPVKVSEVNYKCIKDYPKICVDKYTYNIDITIPANNDGYVISFERCCRNNTIFNVYQPSTTGATFWTYIPGYNTFSQNSSPVFKALPANLLCLNAPVNIDHSASDIDGDSLVYELYTPYTSSSNANQGKNNSTNPGNYSTITWASPYSKTNQINGQPSLTINRKTGKLSLTPTLVGQFVVGIKVLEYRKGILIGETKRDYQFNVTNCVFDVVSSFGVPYYNCSETEVVFQNRSLGSTYYHWDFGVDSTNSDTSNLSNPVYVYKKDGFYTVKLVAKVSNCADTAEFEIYVKRNFVFDIGKDTLICGPFNKTLSANVAGKEYLWNTLETTESIKINKGGTYSIRVSDLPCIVRDTISIVNDLTFLDLGPDSVICRDSFFAFSYTTQGGYKSYNWSNGTSNQSVFISKLDRYWLDVVNKNNCKSSDTIEFLLYPPPKVNLRDTLFCRETKVILDGVNYNFKTAIETNYTWNTEEFTPQITTGIPGLYIVKVKNRLCTIFDSATIDFIKTGLELGNDTFYCGPVYRWFKPVDNYVDYVWNDLSKSQTYLATSPGKKKVTITSREGCVESDSVLLSQFDDVDGGLGNDTAICSSSVFELAASDNMISYLWNTGEVTRDIVVRNQGEYIVTVKNINNCIVSDTINIIENGNAIPSEMYMPNTFSPNNDGVNEYFPGNGYKDPGSAYALIIYNRWGEKIFESNKPENQWNGYYNSQLAPEENYIYYVKYLACDDHEHWFRGTFTLLR